MEQKYVKLMAHTLKKHRVDLGQNDHQFANDLAYRVFKSRENSDAPNEEEFSIPFEFDEVTVIFHGQVIEETKEIILWIYLFGNIILKRRRFQ